MCQGIQEGGDVPANSTPTQLAHCIYALLRESLEGLAEGFPFEFRTMTIREVKLWQDISKKSLNSLYFQGRFMVESKKKDSKALKFKAPSHPVQFALIINATQWAGIQTRIEEIEEVSLLLG